jgi:glycosyltransferase involved in cell wall biosynthesis
MEEYQRLGHECVWVTCDIPRGGRDSKADNIRIPAWNGFERRWQINCPVISPLALPAAFRAVRAADAIHVHSLAPGLSAVVILLSVALRKPMVVTQQVGVIPFQNGFLERLQTVCLGAMARLSIWGGASLTFPTEPLMQAYRAQYGLPDSKLAVSPNAFDGRVFRFANEEERRNARRECGLSEDRCHVLFAGRFVDKKGVGLVEQAARACPDIHFTLVGSGVVDPNPHNLPNVKILPPASAETLRAHFSAHDALLLPAVGEGWPLVLCEAMACGLPAIISEEVFANYGKDREYFAIVPRSVAAIVAELRAFANGTHPLCARREEISKYANRTWSWGRTAQIILNLLGQKKDVRGRFSGEG